MTRSSWQATASATRRPAVPNSTGESVEAYFGQQVNGSARAICKSKVSPWCGNLCIHRVTAGLGLHKKDAVLRGPHRSTRVTF